ncbi:hypothetical protein Nepgr_007038 [Nepenthes gracilis]|uniref:Reverse transcriptase/retrotransposon-derived protein RNase H-like domain-containing protein n=1 Tax=Nepenthes gracilis TaxID=150966 RepID=A0AAD3S671_NEPGR|nr:hypothetical protein Nepgr_007038 [Nepenthes gracilis]
MKASRFRWTDECEEAFKELKAYLVSPPLHSSPFTGEDLYLYLATSDTTLSLVLVREHEGTHRPMYYVSRVLTDVETCYPHAERVALTLIYWGQKLRLYF